ncbi:MAG: TadG family pilus assembly protein [Hyphomonas sp.]
MIQSSQLAAFESMASRALSTRPDDSANVSLVFAFFLPVALVILAFAIDLGSVGLKKREFQGAADLAAILAAQNLSDYERVALDNLSANGFGTRSTKPPGVNTSSPGAEKLPKTKATVERGTYVARPDVPPADRFTPGARPANAVRVTASHEAEFFFASGFAAAPELSVQSVAYVASEASFTIGTRLLRVDGGLANQILNALLGTNVTLSVMDYEALLDADVSLFSTLDALASEASLTALTYSDVLSADVTLSQVANAAALSLPAGDPATKALGLIAADAAAQKMNIDLGALIDLGVLSAARLGSVEGPYSIHTNVLSLLSAAADLSNGERQVALDLTGAVPGIADIRATLLIGERPRTSPWIALTSPDTVVVHTAQTRLLLEARISGVSTLVGTEIALPIYAELASADASLARVSCPGGRETGAFVDLMVTPAVARVRIGNPDPANLKSFRFDKPVRSAILVDTPLFDLLGQASVDIGGRTAQKVRFTSADIAAGTVRTVASKDLAKSLTASLLEDLDLTVKSGSLSVVSPKKAQLALSATLQPVAGELDEILETVLSIAGVSLGEADVRVNGLHCRHAVLVQ